MMRLLRRLLVVVFFFKKKSPLQQIPNNIIELLKISSAYFISTYVEEVQEKTN